MKKLLSLILCAFILLSFSAASASPYDSDTELWDILFLNSEGERIFSPVAGEIGTSFEIYNGGGEKDVYVINRVYNADNRISDIKVLTKTLKSGYNEFSGKSVLSESGSTIKAFVFDKNFAPIKKTTDFESVVTPLEITAFSLTKNSVSYKGLINNKTNTIFIDVPSYTIGEGESSLLKHDLSDAVENITAVGGAVSKKDSNSFYDGTAYSVTDKNGNERIYMVYAKCSLRQYSSDFSALILDDVSDESGSATVSVEGSDETNTVTAENSALLVNKTAVSDNELSFKADKGCASIYITDCKMQFDFKINSISSEEGAMSFFMGEMHHIVPFKTENGYTLKYKCGSLGALNDIPGMGELETGTPYSLTYMFSKSKLCGELYINGKYIATLKNTYGYNPASKLSPIISLTAYKNAVLSAEFDNIEVTYREDTKSDKIDLHIIGDSIVHSYTPNEKKQQGWGAILEESFDNNVNVVNHAVVGQSSGMMLFGGEPKRHDMAPIWPQLKNNLKEGDFVMLSFGWNEGLTANPYNCTSPDNFKEHLSIFIRDTLEVGATPILVTPTLGVLTDGSYTVRDDNHKWAQAMVELAKENSSVICLDLHQKLHEELEPLGGEKILASYHIPATLHYEADGVHFREEGAIFNADNILSLLESSNCPLKNYIKDRPATAEEKRLFTVFDATGKAHIGIVNTEAKTIVVKQITDLYTKRKPDDTALAKKYPSKYYNERHADDFPPITSYISYIDGTKMEGTITLSNTAPATVTIGNDTYTVTLQKHVAATVANLNAGKNIFTVSNDGKSYPANPDSKKIMVVDKYQHVPRTFGGSRYEDGCLNITCDVSSKNIIDIQSLLNDDAFNVSFAPHSGRGGKNDTALKIIKQGSTSSTNPAIYLYENEARDLNWGKGADSVTDFSFDFKYEDFNGTGNALVFQLINDRVKNPFLQVVLKKPADNSEGLGVCYTISGVSTTQYAKIPKNEWSNIRIIFDRNSEKPFKLCVNDKIVFETATKYKEDAAIPAGFIGNVARFGAYSTAECTYYLDNITMTCSQTR